MKRVSTLRCRVGCSIAMLVLPVFVLPAGCARYKYDVELVPTENGLERSVAFGGSSGSSMVDEKGEPAFSKGELEEVARLEAIYGPHSLSESKSAVLFSSKIFADDMPQDVGGSGRYVRFESPLGTAAGYVERFRGNDDVYAQFEARRLAVERFADLIVGWFESELGGEAGWPPLREFLDGDLRRDLQNVSLYVWTLGLLPDDMSLKRETATVECLLRAEQYLVERGYGRYEEIPALMRRAQQADRDGQVDVFTQLSILLATKLPSAAPDVPKESFSFLFDRERARSSWRSYFEKTDVFEREQANYLAKEERELADIQSSVQDPAVRKQEEARLLERRASMHEELLSGLWAASFSPSSGSRKFDNLNVSLAAGGEPVLTNGRWNDEEQRVVWEASIDAEDGEPPRPLDYPAFFYAIWDEPNIAVQRDLFAKAPVRGMELVNYCLWYRGLTDDERRQWDDFVPTLKGDETAIERLEQFHFAGEPAPGEEHPSSAGRGIAIIKKAVNAETD